MSQQPKHDQSNYQAIVCLRTGTNKERCAGARIDLCSKCGHGIWVAPSSDGFVNTGIPLICLECSGVSQDQAAAQYLAQATPEQITELRHHFRHDPDMLARLEAALAGKSIQPER